MANPWPLRFFDHIGGGTPEGDNHEEMQKAKAGCRKWFACGSKVHVCPRAVQVDTAAPCDQHFSESIWQARISFSGNGNGSPTPAQPTFPYSMWSRRVLEMPYLGYCNSTMVASGSCAMINPLS